MHTEQQTLEFYKREDELRRRRAEEAYWRAYAEELNRQYTAMRCASWLLPRVSRSLCRVECVWRRIGATLSDVEIPRKGS